MRTKIALSIFFVMIFFLSFSVSAQDFCTDSDNGMDYLTPGTVSSNWTTYSDFCQNGILTEYYCETNVIKSIEHLCDYGCWASSCLNKCTDLEEKIMPYNWDGSVFYSGSGEIESIEDSCKNGVLKEYYCKNTEEYSFETYECRFGCHGNKACHYESLKDLENLKENYLSGEEAQIIINAINVDGATLTPENGWEISYRVFPFGETSAILSEEATYKNGQWTVDFSIPEEEGKYSLLIEISCLIREGTFCYNLTSGTSTNKFFEFIVGEFGCLADSDCVGERCYGGICAECETNSECTVGKRCVANTCVAEKEPATKCNDSDEGSDYFVKGTTYGKIYLDKTTTSFDTKEDVCNDDSVLKEYVCSNDELLLGIVHTCPTGCSDGACIKTCGEGLILCPNGDCEEKCEEVSVDNCDFGCISGEDCLPIGTIVKGSFCSIGVSIKEQLSVGETCENNFECNSNLCINNECLSGSLWAKFMRWISRIFK